MDATRFKEIGLVEWVNARFPKESHNTHISNGQLFVAMLLNGLEFVSRTLHVYPEYFQTPTHLFLRFRSRFFEIVRIK